MAAEITLTSTTDNEADVRRALGQPVAAPPAEPAPAVADTPDDDVDPEAAAAPPVAETPKPAVKPKPTWAERKAEREAEINRLTAQKIRTEQEVRDLEARRAELTKPAPVAPAREEPAAVAPPPVIATAPPARPKQEDFDDYNQYLKADEEWVDARAGWVATQQTNAVEARLAKQRADEQQAAERAAREAAERGLEAQRAQAYHERLTAARGVHPDFDAVVSSSEVTVPHAIAHVIKHGTQGPELLYRVSHNADLAARIGALELSPPMVDLITRSDQAPELVEYLADHVAEASRLARSHPSEALMEMGRIAERLSSAAKPAIAPAPAAKVAHTRAPAPLPATVGHSTATAVRDLNDPSLTHEEWKALRRSGKTRLSA